MVIREYNQVRVESDSFYHKLSPAEEARQELRRIRDLVVGKPAPEIVGKGVDGKPIRLSDYRGKVVVLSFWATWCSPCMSMVPHEQELVERMKGKPFVFLGISGDEDRERLKFSGSRNTGSTGPHGTTVVLTGLSPRPGLCKAGPPFSCSIKTE